MADRTTTDRPRRPAPMAVTVLRTSRISADHGAGVVRRPRTAAVPALGVHRFLREADVSQPGVTYPEPFDLGGSSRATRSRQWPVVRTYTVAPGIRTGSSWPSTSWCTATRASPARGRPPRSPATGSSSPAPAARTPPIPTRGWHLLVGDESALPAIAAAVESLAADAEGQVLIEVPGAESEITCRCRSACGSTGSTPAAGRRPAGAVEAVAALTIPAVDVQAFVHGEAGFVADLRRLLRVDVGLPRDRLSISGYWRLGATEEGWRAAKADWNAAAEEIERRAGVA